MTQLDLLGAVIFFQDAFHHIEKLSDLDIFSDSLCFVKKRLNEQKNSLLSENITDGNPDDESQMSLALIDRAVDQLANFKAEHIKHLVPVLSAIFAIRPQVHHTDNDEYLLVFTAVEDFTVDSEWAKCLVDIFNSLISNRRAVVSLEETINYLPLMRQLILLIRFFVKLRKIYEIDPMLYLDEEYKKKFTRSFELLEQTLAGIIDSLLQENGMNFNLFRENLSSLSHDITELSSLLNQISKILEDEFNKQRNSRRQWSLGTVAGIALFSVSFPYTFNYWGVLTSTQKLAGAGLSALGVGTVVGSEYKRQDLQAIIETHACLANHLNRFSSVLNEMEEYIGHNLMATNSNLKIREIALIGSFKVFQKNVKETRQSLKRGILLPYAPLKK
ncbi:hypothetical protein G9A89_001375 [Geosiphon pyriformis]|nr:hypothetical protein G9A89_001375 [Geosiphon pyriformis]